MTLEKCFVPFCSLKMLNFAESNALTYLSITYAVFSSFFKENGFWTVYSFSRYFCLFAADCNYILLVTTFLLFN